MLEPGKRHVEFSGVLLAGKKEKFNYNVGFLFCLALTQEYVKLIILTVRISYFNQVF